MKLQCKKCGKKEAELMSRLDIKRCDFLAPSDISKILDKALDLIDPKYIVCKACGHYEKQ